MCADPQGTVLITDAGGTVARSFVHLPEEFPSGGVRRGQAAGDATAGARSVYRVRLQIDGTVTHRFVVRLRSRASVSAPARVTEGRRSTRLSAGESVTFRLVTHRGRRDLTTTKVVARSIAIPRARDRVWTRTTWR